MRVWSLALMLASCRTFQPWTLSLKPTCRGNNHLGYLATTFYILSKGANPENISLEFQLSLIISLIDKVTLWFSDNTWTTCNTCRKSSLSPQKPLCIWLRLYPSPFARLKLPKIVQLSTRNEKRHTLKLNGCMRCCDVFGWLDILESNERLASASKALLTGKHGTHFVCTPSHFTYQIVVQ